ncbi:MAG TPA: HD domain-containing phosphohydrolase [Gemmatimonadaceae bacterium]|nr:HD domain-containing phosphohydrolase [Gemmatimonadaceae bacterium]
MTPSLIHPDRLTPPDGRLAAHRDPWLAREPRILIADDVAANVRLLRSILVRAGYREFHTTTTGSDVVPAFLEYRPDIALLDLHMPGVDGIGNVRDLRRLAAADPYMPIIVVTGDASMDARHASLDAGASDFVTKPYDSAEVVLRVRNHLETRRLHLVLAEENRVLEQRVEERTAALLAARLEVLERLAIATEIRDDDTGEHTRRVGRLAADLSRHLGEGEEAVDLIARVAPLHDIGKIAIPDQILRKPGPLTAAEFDVMKTHTTTGASILGGGGHALIRTAEQIALTHHERWDGSGYPHGLREREIPMEGRIVAVADFYDALTHDRVYRPAVERDAVIDMIIERAKTQFDPDVVRAIIELAERAPLAS